MTPRRKVLTGQELEIMKIVWDAGQATVRDVYEAMLKRRKIAYTTVLTMMGILESKKFLTRTAGDRAHVYRPSRPKKEVVGRMVRDFLDRVFNGSAKPLLLHLVESRQVDRRELEEIAAFLKEKRK